ncbi:carbamoyltransferase C-terminal domain-containing protein [Salinibacter ruber]|uniref:carbamoyltransferase C-terminal domain-containing protein n=1 Tax=Salinibacter ruber TaxID=146919 RepID=UPI003C6DF71A
MNNRVKYREEFRPFAPSILEEAVDAYFDGYDTSGSNNVGAAPRPEGGSSLRAAPDPFMQQVYPVREDKQDEIPAVTPVDGTDRLQAVGKDRNPAYHRLISAFAEKTETLVVLNTSFNENGPTFESPEQALDCFFRTVRGAVGMENTLVQRQPVEATAAGAPRNEAADLEGDAVVFGVRPPRRTTRPVPSAPGHRSSRTVPTRSAGGPATGAMDPCPISTTWVQSPRCGGQAYRLNDGGRRSPLGVLGRDAPSAADRR